MTLDGDDMTVLYCNYRITQHIDESGRPASIPVGGLINITVESTSSTSLYDWMIDPTQVKSGTITFYRRDAMSQLKTVSFTDAYCIEFNEEYSHKGEHPLQISVTISARELKVSDSAFAKNWPD
jgi:type VI protein secretion system component Hcp